MLRPTPDINRIQSEWRNWSHTHAVATVNAYRPETLEELVAVAKLASSTNRIKASGSRWSSSAAAKPEDSWVDTTLLNKVIEWDLSAITDGSWADGNRIKNMVLIEAGIKLHELVTALWANGLSVPTLGGRLGQSIAGAISTGTHGSDIGMPAVSDIVRAIHLVTPGGKEYWLEHPDRPVSSHQKLKKYTHWHPSISYLRDREAFNSALVSAGRCGYIYAYVLEVQAAFKMREEHGPAVWPEIKKYLSNAAISGNWLSHIRNNELPFNGRCDIRSGGAPKLISVNNRLSVLWGGTNNPGQFRWVHEINSRTGRWSRRQIINDGRQRHSNHEPSIAFHNGHYYVVWTGPNQDRLHLNLLRSTDGSGEFWSHHIRFMGESTAHPSTKSGAGPHIFSANERLHIVWLGSNRPGKMRWITSRDGIEWSDKRVLSDRFDSRERRSFNSPTAAYFRGRYYVAWTGSKTYSGALPRPINLMCSTNAFGSRWGSYIKFDGEGRRPKAISSEAPVLFVANNKLHLVWLGPNLPAPIWWMTTEDGINWGNKQKINANYPKSYYSPSIVFHQGKYHLAWTGTDKNIHILNSVDSRGTSWTSHSILSCPSGPTIAPSDIRTLKVTINPISNYGQSWWTLRQEVPNETPDTIRKPEQHPDEQNLYLTGAAIALRTSAPEALAGIVSGGVGAAIGLFALGPLGALLGGGFLGLGGGVTVAEVKEHVFLSITESTFGEQFTRLARVGPSFEISSGHANGWDSYHTFYETFWNKGTKVQFTEIFFDAENTDYLIFIDNVLEYLKNYGGVGHPAGYIAIRFMSPSEAPLAMQRWNVTVAVEVVFIEKLLPNARAVIDVVNTMASIYDVRYHLGMQRIPSYKLLNRETQQIIQQEIEAWRIGAAKLKICLEDGLSTIFSREEEFEPLRKKAKDFLLWMG